VILRYSAKFCSYPSGNSGNLVYLRAQKHFLKRQTFVVKVTKDLHQAQLMQDSTAISGIRQGVRLMQKLFTLLTFFFLFLKNFVLLLVLFISCL